MRLPREQLQRLDDACDRFEMALRAGEKPDMEVALEGFAEPERSIVARELRALEHQYREEPADDSVGDTRAPHQAKRATKMDISLSGDVSISVPLRFGDYELLDKLGQGGMGEVFRARQISANRVVVLKIIRRDRLEEVSPAKRRQWVERFRSEARAAAQMEHENVVPVYQVGEVDGQHYYSMRLIEGKSLGELVEEGPLPPERAAGYVEKIARAVHHAHSRGILHRDLKPRNIIVDAEDRPYVTDFGLAKWLLGESIEPTAQGALVGSPPYIAPEQIADASRVTAAADIYSLGATLYHLLTGRPPFQCGTIHETLLQVQHQLPVPPARLRPGLSRDLETVCLKCLHKDERRRYATALDLADDLARYLSHEPVRARRAPPWEHVLRWAKRNVAALGVAGVFLIIMALLVIQQQLAPPQASQAPEVLPPQVEVREPLTAEKAEQLGGAAQALELWAVPEAQRLAFLNELDEYDRLATNADADSRTEAARASWVVGRMRERLGQLGAAEAAYRRAAEGWKALADPDCAREQARAVHDLADVCLRLGKWKPAEEALVQAGALWKAEGPGSSLQRAQCQAGLAALYASLGGREKEADTALQRAVAILEGEPASAAFQHELAKALNIQGMFAWRRGQLAQADAAFDRAARLLKASEQRPADRLALARTELIRGDCWAARGAPANARECYGQAIYLLEGLHSAHPLVTVYTIELALAHSNIGLLLQPVDDANKGPSEKGANAFGKAQTLLKELPDEPLEDIGARRVLSLVRSNVATGLLSLDDWGGADAAYRAAIADQQVLVKQSPPIAADRDALGRSWNGLARLQLTRLRHLFGLRDWIFSITSGDPWLAGYCVWLNGKVKQEAWDSVHEAVHIHDELMLAESADPRYRSHLLDDLATLVEVAVLWENHRAAAAAAERMPGLAAAADVAKEHAIAGETLACCVAVAHTDETLSANERIRFAEDYASRAVRHFHSALTGGWTNLEHLRQSPADTILKGRRDYTEFKRLLQAAQK
jgi:tRNA A-37 threonylcarbamoyl transferase component Bud32/tetratricopeptide (TPR) repeat protein